MSNPKLESLDKLLDFIDDLCKKEENKWFKEKLIEKFSTSTGFENFPSFLKYQKKQFRIKGRHFYANVKDEKLKQELINDYVEMAWYQSINNMNRFVLFAFYQMENLLNYYVILSNGLEKINANKDYFTISYDDKFNIDCLNGFFSYDRYKNEYTPKPIEKINIWSKLTFWVLDSDSKEWEKFNHSNISNMINIRNANSHRSSNTNNDSTNKTIEYLNKSDFSSLGFYINILKRIVDSFEKVDPKVKIYEIKIERKKLAGLTVKGNIDLSKAK